MQVRFLLVVVVTGCATASSSRSFEADRVDAICLHAETCDPAGFAALWGSQRECAQDYEASTHRSAAAFRGCEIRSGNAQSCLGDLELAIADCSSLDEVLQSAVCEDVWACAPTLCEEVADELESCGFRLWWNDQEPPDGYCLPGSREHCEAECAIEATCTGVRPGDYDSPAYRSYSDCREACASP